ALVSHGCVRMLPQDLFDLAEKIVAARSLPVSPERIAAAKAGTKRLTVELDPPLWVDVNYDTAVIEGGRLRLYPDVYDRGGDDLERLRLELEANGLPATAIDEETYVLMRCRVVPTEEYVVTLDYLAGSRSLSAWQSE